MPRRKNARRPRKSLHGANYFAVLERLEGRILLTNDLFANRIDLGSAAAVTTQGTNVGFTGEPGEPSQSGPINSAWWSWTAPDSGVLVVDTNGSNFDTFLTLATGSTVDELTVLQQDDDDGDGVQSLIVAQVTAGTQYHIAVDGFADDIGEITLNVSFMLPNDDFADRIDLGSATAVTTHGTNVGFTGEPDEPSQSGPINSAWWSWTAPESGVLIVDTDGSNFDTFLTLATGTDVAGLTVVAQNDNTPFEETSQIAVNVTAGTQYHIAVDGFADFTGAITLNVSLFLPNDNFADRVDLGSDTALTTQGTNIGFTGEPDEPAQSGAINSAWWTWTAPMSGLLVVDTRGSNFDTFLTLATGTDVNGLTVVAQNDNTRFDDFSQLAVSVTKGTQYHIAVDGFEGETGLITLNLFLNTFTNDNFADRIDLGEVALLTTTGNNAGFSGERGEPDQNEPITSAWWSWTAPASGQVIIDTNGSNFDAFLTLATGPAVDALTVVAQDDDGGFGVQSQIVADVTAGTQYHIAVDGFADFTGAITLNVSFIGTSFVDADNDGRFTAGTDVALVDGELDDGFFDTRRPEGGYTRVIPGAGLVLGGEPVVQRRDVNFRADGSVTVYADLTAGDDIKLTSRNGNFSVIGGTITAGDEIEITAAHEILVSDAEIVGSDKVELTSAGANIEASFAVIEALGSSDGEIELTAARDIDADFATLRAAEDVKLRSLDGDIDVFDAVIEALGDSDGEIELKAAGHVIAVFATLRASEQIELRSTNGNVDVFEAVIEALGDSDGEIKLTAADHVVAAFATLRANEEVSLTAKGGDIDVDFAIIEALGDSDGEIELKAADDIFAEAAALRARDEIELQAKRGSIDATAASFTADKVELEAALDIHYCAARVTSRKLKLEWGRLLDNSACVLPEEEGNSE